MKKVFLLVILLILSANANLLDAQIATGSDQSNHLKIDSQETLLISSSAASGVKIYSISGANSWTTSSKGALNSLALAQYSCGIWSDLSSDENYLFVACGASGLKVFDISGKNSWSTSSPTNLTSLLIGSYTGNVYSVKVSKTGYFVFVGTDLALQAYDIRTIGSWTNQDISLLPKFGSTSALAVSDVKSIYFMKDENFAFIAGAGAFLINIQGQSTFITNTITISFSVVASTTAIQFTKAVPSPDFTYAWLGRSGQGHLISLSGYASWSSQDLGNLVVAKLVDASILDHAQFLNGPNYLLVGNLLIYDLRSRFSWAPTTATLATNIFANNLDSWTSSSVSFFVQNSGLTRLYVSLGASGINALSYLSADGWTVAVCAVGTYFQGSDCYSCKRTCGVCYDQFDCDTCVGDQAQAYSRLQNLKCECPASGYLDNVWNNPVSTTCTAGSACSTGLVKVNSRCINEDCLIIGQEFNTSKVTLTVSQATINTEVNFQFLFNYAGAFPTAAVTSWTECYSSTIFIEEDQGGTIIKHYLPVSVSGLQVSGKVRMNDLLAYGCTLVSDATSFTYNCNTKWVNSFFTEVQQTVGSVITIVINRSSNATLNITVGQTTTTTGCIGCDSNYQVSSVVDLIDNTGALLGTDTFFIGDTVRMRVQIQDAGLRPLYFLQHVSTTMQTAGFNLTLVPTERDSTTRGTVIVSFKASLSATSASIVVSCTLQTTLPTYTVLRRGARMMQAQQQSLVASVNLNIVDPNQAQENQTKDVKENLTVVVFVSVAGMMSFMMVSYHLYEGYCRDNLTKAQKTLSRNNQFTQIYSKFQNQNNSENRNTENDDPDKPHFKLNNLKVEEIQ